VLCDIVGRRQGHRTQLLERHILRTTATIKPHTTTTGLKETGCCSSNTRLFDVTRPLTEIQCKKKKEK
jgi:hypothetical protein